MTVGNLHQHPYKGLDVLLLSWTHVVKKFPDARLIVVGGDSTRDKRFTLLFKNQLNQLNIVNSVEFAGYVNHIDQMLERASVFVLPSRIEGLSNALLEAMAFGLPCIATSISGSRDLIQDGVNGILVPPENVDLLSDKIIQLFDAPELADTIGKEARRTVAGHYQMETVANFYVNSYQELLVNQR